MRTDRLLSLALFLENFVPEENFNMDVWANTPTPCGSAGCALGWATMVPAFRAAGLRLVPVFEDEPKADQEPEFHGEKQYNAAEVFFEIDDITSRHIFCPMEYEGRPSPQDVATRIRRVVSHGF